MKTQRQEVREANGRIGERVIEPAVSKWATFVVTAPKKDAKLRFCVDNKKLSATIVGETYPPSLTDGYVDAIRDAAVLSTILCSIGYWQIEMHKRVRGKTTLSSFRDFYDKLECLSC